MKDQRIRVGLLWGGEGYEREVSAKGREFIEPYFDREKYRLLPIFINEAGEWIYDGRRITPNIRPKNNPHNSQKISSKNSQDTPHRSDGQGKKEREYLNKNQESATQRGDCLTKNQESATQRGDCLTKNQEPRSENCGGCGIGEHDGILSEPETGQFIQHLSRPEDSQFIYCDSGEGLRVDCVFPLLHGNMGEDGAIQGALETAHIPYVGCGVSASAVTRDKAMLKMIASSVGIPTLPYLLSVREEGREYALRAIEATMDYPVIVKPATLGSSIGVSPAYNRSQLYSAIEEAFSLCDRIITEPYIEDKREIECAYLSIAKRELFSPPGEVHTEGFYNLDSKLSGRARLSVRADLDPRLVEEVRYLCRRLTRAVGIRDLSRFDFFLTKERLYLNEVNTMPGFTQGSLYPMMIEGAGISLSAMLDGLINRAMSR